MFSANRKRKSSLFGPDVTSNFREGLEKNVRESWTPPPPHLIETDRMTLLAML